MSRTDCLFCRPYSQDSKPQTQVIVIQIPSEPSRVTSVTIDRRTRRHIPIRNSTSRPQCIKDLSHGLYTLAYSIYILASMVAGVIVLGYVGKVYVWAYVNLCDYDTPWWFGWDKLDHILVEAAGGTLATAVLAGCCVGKG